MSKNKTIKFFISSTFKDFEAERNILQKFVFPKLKELCNKKGFGFQYSQSRRLLNNSSA